MIKDNPPPLDDPKCPKFLRINIRETYKKTGLPKPARKATDEEKDVFMASNLLRVYKRLLIDILEDYAEYIKRTQGRNQ